MGTHRIYGVTRVESQAVARRIDVIDAAVWAELGLEAARVGSTISSAVDGTWSVDLDSGELVYVLTPAVAPYAARLLGPFRPELL